MAVRLAELPASPSLQGDQLDVSVRWATFGLVLLNFDPSLGSVSDVRQGFFASRPLRPAASERGHVDDVASILSRLDDDLELHALP
jgi:hypothetical protein